jgi:hypothetical protein
MRNTWKKQDVSSPEGIKKPGETNVLYGLMMYQPVLMTEIIITLSQ